MNVLLKTKKKEHNPKSLTRKKREGKTKQKMVFLKRFLLFSMFERVSKQSLSKKLDDKTWVEKEKHSRNKIGDKIRFVFK